MDTSFPDFIAHAFAQFATQAEFGQLIVGKLLRHTETNTFTIHADGTMTGDFGRAALEAHMGIGRPILVPHPMCWINPPPEHRASAA